MYPSISLFHPKVARAVLNYRVSTIDGAQVNAQQQGYKVNSITYKKKKSLYYMFVFVIFKTSFY